MKKVRGLKNLLYGIPIAVASFLPMKNSNAQEHVVVPFIQPNHSDLNWYGSGDVNNDNTLNWNDISRLDSIINENYIPNLNSENPAEYRTLDRADINGDGVVDYEDKNLLEDRLNGSIDYLPGEWDKLGSKEERETLHEQRHLFQWNNKLDTIPYIPGVYECDDFGRLNVRDFHGFPEMGYDKETGWRDNGRYNIPEFYIEFIKLGLGHVVTGAVTGDKIKTFNDWDIREINGLKYGRDIAFPENCEVVINYSYVNHSSQGDYLASTPILKFQLTNENPELIWENNDPNVKVIKQRDTTPSKINASVSLEGKLNWNIIENENFENAKYKINDGEEIDIGQSGTKDLNLPNENYEITIKAKNYFEETDTTFNFKVDKPVSLEKEVLDSKVKVYPNPATDFIMVESGKMLPSELELYSLDGKRIIKEKSENGNMNIDVSYLPPAVYLYKYENSDGVKSGKVIVR